MNDGRGQEEFAGTKRFMILRRLGAGGMGVVYEALDRENDTKVALKTLRTFKPDAILRFKNSEFRALQGIQHKNLASLLELFDEGGQLFFTMEMVHGVHFLDYVRRAPDAILDAPSPESASADECSTLDLPPAERHATPAPPRAKLLASGVDEHRLRSALAQLALGLAALHRAHKVHRDIKPSNILVTTEGRVVILDFGLVADLENRMPEAHLVGTYSYMAPEQASLKPVEAAADWYSVGVLLYQALTSRMPVPGTAREVLVMKQAYEPIPPSAIVDVPADLDRLCIDLLRIDPAARPKEREILARLGVEAPPDDPDFWSHERHFVGRKAELSALQSAFASARAEGLTLIVHGESGVGKSALTRRFAELVAEGDPSTVVFSGRCYERESVPYKAVDGIIDALSRYLTTLDEPALAAVLPRQKGLLGQIFPVMRKIEAIATAPRPMPGALDPQVLRARLFFALRDLFTRLAEHGPLLLVIDDLQWADADSLALLAEITRPPDAPKLLLLATVRAALTTEARRAGRGETSLHSVEQLATLFTGDVQRLSIQSLPREDARALVTALLRDAGSPGDLSASGLAEEAGGHPLFIDELVRRKLIAGSETGAIRLEDALWSRIKRLDPGPRGLLELVAVAGAPVTQETAAQAARVEFSELSREAGLLRAQNLVRTGGVRRSDTVETYHDRVREAVLLNLAPDARTGWHRRLAVALEAAAEIDPETLAVHWQGAGEPERAAFHAKRAAALAADALAFDRAARLYRLALDLYPSDGDQGVTLRIELGDALANAGRGAEAARAYLDAVAVMPATAAVESTLDLRRKIAEQLLRSGLVDEGLEQLDLLLGTIDMELPKTPHRALASLLVRRVRVRLRGIDFRERAATDIPPALLQRVDICWSASIVLGMVDNIRGADFQARGLLLALEAGEPFRVARALAAEACFASTPGSEGKARTEMLLKAAEACAHKTQQPFALAFAALADGVAAYCMGEFRRSYESSVRAKELLINRCTGVAWERETADLYTILSAFYLGHLRDQAARVEQGARLADERGDLFASTYVRSGLAMMAWLARGDVEGARAVVAETEERWSSRGYFLAHFWCFIASAQIDLYAGDPARAKERVEAEWPRLSQSLMLRSIQIVRVESLHVRARAALALAPLAEARKERLLRDAESDAKELTSERLAYATPLAELVRAGLSATRGDSARAASQLGAAIAAFEAADMRLYAAAARLRRGELLADTEAITAATAWMQSEGIADPARFTAMLAPGFPAKSR
jgi:serine/threonine protein kinase/tetratricopeptide (TPR) repeat protein